MADTRPNLPADKVPESRNVWSLPVHLLDKRTREWKRRGEIVAMLSAQFAASTITSGLQRQIDAAAELLTIAELARARYLSGEGISLDDVVRIERAAGLAEKRLGQQKPQTPKPDLGTYLAGRAA